MKPQGSSINKPGSKYSPAPVIYNRALFKMGATDPIANRRVLRSVYCMIDAQAKDKRQRNQPKNVPRRMERKINGGSPVKRRG